MFRLAVFGAVLIATITVGCNTSAPAPTWQDLPIWKEAKKQGENRIFFFQHDDSKRLLKTVWVSASGTYKDREFSLYEDNPYSLPNLAMRRGKFILGKESGFLMYETTELEGDAYRVDALIYKSGEQ